MVEEAGCEFVSYKQLLVRNACLLPNYQSNELPYNSEGETNIKVNLYKAFVLEIDEHRNRVTLKIVQFMKWADPRIKTNYSAFSDPAGVILLSQDKIKQTHL